MLWMLASAVLVFAPVQAQDFMNLPGVGHLRWYNGRAGGAAVSDSDLCGYRAFEPTWSKLREFVARPQVARKLELARQATHCNFSLEIDVKGSPIDISLDNEWVGEKKITYPVHYLGYSSRWQMHGFKKSEARYLTYTLPLSDFSYRKIREIRDVESADLSASLDRFLSEALASEPRCDGPVEPQPVDQRQPEAQPEPKREPHPAPQPQPRRTSTPKALPKDNLKSSLDLAKKRLERARTRLNDSLMFPLPRERHLAFILDGSVSITYGSRLKDLKYLDLARAHLKVTLSLLEPDQDFVLAMSGIPPKTFNQGRRLSATPDNVQAAKTWIDQLNTDQSDDENFEVVIANLIRSSGKPDHTLIYTDGIVDRSSVGPLYLQAFGNSKTPTDISPIGHENCLRTIAEGPRKVAGDLSQFMFEVTAGSGGNILPVIQGLPDAARIDAYRKAINEWRRARAALQLRSQQ